MKCHFCGHPDTIVKDSRSHEHQRMIKRRRFCPSCQGRFTTFERAEFTEMTILKKDGHRVPFDRDKLIRSITVAMRKRPARPEDVEKAIQNTLFVIESRYEETKGQITTAQLGDIALQQLKNLDDVGYIRFASVYRAFASVDDFYQVLNDLEKNKAPKTWSDGELPPVYQETSE